MSDPIHNPPEPTPPESNAGYAAFLRRALLFGIPLVVVTGLPMLILAATRESFMSLDQVARAFEQHNALVGFAYNENNYPWLKFHRLSTLPPQAVVALGSSRVLTFREHMFTDAFFNAGYTIQSAADFQSFLELLPADKSPDILLIGLDQWMFNPDWNAATRPSVPSHWTQPPANGVRTALKLTPKVYTDLFRGRISLPAAFGSDSADVSSPGVIRIGLNGIMNHKGFRNDGSFNYGRQIDQLLDGDPGVRDHGFEDTLGRVRQGANRFNYGDAIDEAAVGKVSELLEFCKTRRIHVVAILPPFADCVYAAMQQSQKHEYLQQLLPRLQPLFAQHDFELHAFPDMSSCGSSDAEAVDGFHGGEVCYLRLLLQLTERHSRLAEYIDPDQLRSDLKSAVNRYAVYPD